MWSLPPAEAADKSSVRRGLLARSRDLVAPSQPEASGRCASPPPHGRRAILQLRGQRRTCAFAQARTDFPHDGLADHSGAGGRFPSLPIAAVRQRRPNPSRSCDRRVRCPGILQKYRRLMLSSKKILDYVSGYRVRRPGSWHGSLIHPDWYCCGESTSLDRPAADPSSRSRSRQRRNVRPVTPASPPPRAGSNDRLHDAPTAPQNAPGAIPEPDTSRATYSGEITRHLHTRPQA
jgi:hypothetical protein